VKVISGVRPQFREKGNVFPLHNTPARSAWISYPPYAPDLALFYTPKMKTALTQKRFWDIKQKEKNVTDNLHAVPLHVLDDDCSVKHLQRLETCVAIKGLLAWK
jgi:hypothetical protein